MRSRMSPGEVFKISLEVGIVPRERVDRVIHIRLRERGVDHKIGVPRCVRRGVQEVKGIITADVVRYGVGDCDILETAGGDLEIVLWLAPGS